MAAAPMNPFTKYLRQWSADTELGQFIDLWDRLERVVVGVYREKMPPDVATSEFTEVWPRLRGQYPSLESGLRSYWQNARAAGEPARTDPFQLLLDLPDSRAITGNWQAMQYLPAAREALNQYLLDHNALDNKVLDNNALDHNALDHKALDNKALDHNALDHNQLDHNQLDHNGSST